MGKIKYSLFGLPWEAQAKTAVFGVAYDATSELAKGALAFPASIRLASYGVEWPHADASDFGDLLPPIEPEKMAGEVKEFLDGLWSRGFRRFLVLGGNHSVTVPVVEFLAEHGLKRYVQFDAHDDFRNEFMGTRHSFACTLRRVSEAADIALVGVRSFSGEKLDFPVIMGSELEEKKEEVKKLVADADYVSVDMDVLSNSVTNPEPHDLMDLSYLLDVLPRMSGAKMGVDIVEGVPSRIYGDPVGTMGALIARRVLNGD